jgi:hypothetical protein
MASGRARRPLAMREIRDYGTVELERSTASRMKAS